MRRFVLLAVASLLLLGYVAGLARGAAPSATLSIYEYAGGPLVCGGDYTIDRWIVGKLQGTGGSADVRVDTWTGDAGENLPKFDRVGFVDVPLDGLIGNVHWFPSPEGRGEPYDWRFELRVNGEIASECTITVTRV